MKYFILAGLLAALAAVAHAHQQCQTYFLEHHGSCYRFTSGVRYSPAGVAYRQEGMRFHEADRYCRALHPMGHLVTINSASEQEFIFNMVPSFEPIETWIGLFFNASAYPPQWEWVTGEPLMYTAWEPFYGEPLLRFGGAAIMFASEVFTQNTTLQYGYGLEVSDYWITEVIDEPFPFICEYPLSMTHQPQQPNTTMGPETTPDMNSTAEVPTAAGPTAFAPQVLFQQEPAAFRLSDVLKFGGLSERKTGARNHRARPAAPQGYHQQPQGYKQQPQGYSAYRDQKYTNGFQVMP